MDEKALICEYDKCKLILEVPITLPCGNTLCEQHVKQFDENFKCFFCAEYHEMPKIEAFRSLSDVNCSLVCSRESFSKFNTQ